MYMTEKIWNEIIRKLSGKKIEIQTVPKTGTGVWFCTEAINGRVFISKGINHEPKSKVSESYIPKDEFERMYPIYLRRKCGEQVSQEATRACRHQVYIYAIFNYCGF